MKFAAGHATFHLAAIHLAALLLASSGFAQTYTDKGEASLTIETDAAKGRQLTTTVESKYLDVQYQADGWLKGVTTIKRWSGAEGMESSTTLELRQNDGTGQYSKVVWKLIEPGAEFGVVNDEFASLVEYGCCGSEDVTRLFEIKTGRKVEAAYGKILNIEVPNSGLKARYISQALDSQAPQTAQGKKYVATVSYYSTRGIISRVRVYLDLPFGWATGFNEIKITSPVSKTEFNGNRATLWGANGVRDALKAYSGFALETDMFYDSKVAKIKIAINGDKVDAANSTATSDVYLEFVK